MRTSTIKKRLTALGLSNDQCEQALAYFMKVKTVAKTERNHYSRRAPFKMWSVCKAMPWEADLLPDDLEPIYGNNVSNNGDRFAWMRFGVLKDKATGRVLREFPYEQMAEVAANADPEVYEVNWISRPQPIPVGDTCIHWDEDKQAHVEIQTKSLAYWVRGKYHPRHWFARWVWLGIRNRASNYVVTHGQEIKRTDLIEDSEVFGDYRHDAKNPGDFVIRVGNAWQYRSYEKTGPFVVWRNFGCKLEDCFKWPDIQPETQKVMVAYTPWACKIKA